MRFASKAKATIDAIAQRRGVGAVSRRHLLAGTAGAAVGVVSVQQPSANAAESSGGKVGFAATGDHNVLDYGAVGDGLTNDTAAINAAIIAARGAPIAFTSNRTYVVDNVLIAATAELVIDPGTVLLARPNMGNNPMFKFIGTSLVIRGGGVINGNKLKQSGRPFIVVGAIPERAVVSCSGVTFLDTVASVIRASNFGGTVTVTNCAFIGQAEHDGLAGHFSTIMTIVSGQADTHGVVRFNHNTCIGTDAPALPGGSPGGIFVATNGYLSGGPGSPGFADGNLATLEVIGNSFYGYGQNCAGNDISPVHTYPAVGGARIIGNYFEKSGFCAISGKSAQDFICIGNVIVNGQISPQNVSSEGAISYMPGYNAAAISRPRAVISGNIIDKPGGQSTQNKQHGIAVHGIPSSFAESVVIADNVIAGCGTGIQMAYISNVSVHGNIIEGSTDGAVGVEHGMRVDQARGCIVLADNQVRTANGYGLFAAQIGTLTGARFVLNDNVFEHTSPQVACIIRGVALAKFSGNTFTATNGKAVVLGGDGTNSTRVLAWDASNIILAGDAVFDFAWIKSTRGHISYPRLPEGVVSAPPGTFYTDLSGSPAGVLWLKVSADGSPVGWKKMS